MGWVAHGFSRGGHDSANHFESPTSEEMAHPSNHVCCSTTAAGRANIILDSLRSIAYALSRGRFGSTNRLRDIPIFGRTGGTRINEHK